MVLFNYSTKEITAKIVYYGPGLCGKTTNLQFIYENLPKSIGKGKMLSLATKTDRTLFFDFLPIDLGTIRGMRTRLQLYTVPGQVFYNTTRKLVLKGADGIVFVADSQKRMIDANLESFKNLEENLIEHGMNLAEIPLIIQFNKRDLPEVATIEELNAALNKSNVPIYEAVATTGIGVQETLKAMTRLVLNSLKERYAEKRSVKSAPSVQPARPAMPGSPGPSMPSADARQATPSVQQETEKSTGSGADEGDALLLESDDEPMLEIVDDGLEIDDDSLLEIDDADSLDAGTDADVLVEASGVEAGSPADGVETPSSEPEPASPFAERDTPSAEPEPTSPFAGMDSPSAEPEPTSPFSDMETSSSEPATPFAEMETPSDDQEPASPFAGMETPSPEPEPVSPLSGMETLSQERESRPPVDGIDSPPSETPLTTPFAESETPPRRAVSGTTPSGTESESPAARVEGNQEIMLPIDLAIGEKTISFKLRISLDIAPGGDLQVAKIEGGR